MGLSRVSKRGLTTIPAEVRRKAGINEGDYLLWEFDEEEGVILVRVVKNPYEFLRGKYEDVNITYEAVEERADRILEEEALNARDRTRHVNSPC